LDCYKYLKMLSDLVKNYRLDINKLGSYISSIISFYVGLFVSMSKRLQVVSES